MSKCLVTCLNVRISQDIPVCDYFVTTLKHGSLLCLLVTTYYHIVLQLYLNK